MFLHTKYTSLFENVCVKDVKIICIIETWLNDSFCNHNVFPDNYIHFCMDRDYTDSKLTRVGCVLTAVHRSFSCCKSRYDLELT
jgi:hypothetical protein